MLNYEKHFASNRQDGRYVCTIAAQMARMRDMTPLLAYSEGMDAEQFEKWKEAVKNKLESLLCMPNPTEQPKPVCLSCVQRDGYRVEKWEFYPDDYTAVPFLALIPDQASEDNPVPAVLCFLGSNHSKEFVAGEPLLDHPNCKVERYPERNRMAKYIVESGMAAFVFDNPAIGECSLMGEESFGQTQFHSRVQLCDGYLRMGWSYIGVSVFQKLQFMEHLRSLSYVDQGRIAISSHSLGTETAIVLGLLCKDIKAIVFNDALVDEIKHYTAVTEEPENQMVQDIGNWHVIPGMMQFFRLCDLCAAFAPRYLGLTEGGGDDTISMVKNAYKLAQAEEHLLVSYYTEYQDPQTRTHPEGIPKFGLTDQEYYDYNYIAVKEHSYRKEPALTLLKQCFEQ